MKSKALGTRRQLLSFLGGVPIAMGSFDAASEQPKILVLPSYFSPETFARRNRIQRASVRRRRHTIHDSILWSRI